MSSLSYVRSELAAPEAPPRRSTGALAWARKNLFATPGDAVLTFLALAFLWWAVPPVYGWFIGNAVWPGGTVDQCRLEVAGACWAYISSEMEFFLYGFYPIAETWRVNVFYVMLAGLIIPLLWPRAPFKTANAILFFVVFPVVSVILLLGGWFGLPYVPTEMWGGLMVTLIVAITGICLSLPLGILLALGRRSKLPVIKTLCVAFIELVRAVPLISVLFFASIMLPLFMPQGTTVDKFLRALVGVSLFSAAYMAEVVRGGMQAIPRGQYEAASALGLSYWKSMGLIILPQALKHVIPGIVNSFIALFKDTSLVYIVGMKDLLEAVKTKNDTALEWQSAQTATTGYAFAAIVFWAFCFSMSRYSQYMERRLHTGHRR